MEGKIDMPGLGGVIQAPKTKNYRDKCSLKKINQIQDKGLKINLLMRLLGKKNRQIKYLKGMLRTLQQNNPVEYEKLINAQRK